MPNVFGSLEVKNTCKWQFHNIPQSLLWTSFSEGIIPSTEDKTLMSKQFQLDIDGHTWLMLSILILHVQDEQKVARCGFLFYIILSLQIDDKICNVFFHYKFR